MEEDEEILMRNARSVLGASVLDRRLRKAERTNRLTDSRGRERVETVGEHV